MELPKEEATRLFDYASELYEFAEYEKALKVLEELIEHRPDSRRVIFALADCQYRLNQINESVKLCDRLLDEHDYEPARKLRAKLEKKLMTDVNIHGAMDQDPTHINIPGMGDEDMLNPFTLPKMSKSEVPPTRLGPPLTPPPLPQKVNIGEDTPLTLYLRITGALIFLAGLNAGITLLFEPENSAMPLQIFILHNLLLTVSYPVCLGIVLLLSRKLPKETILENISYLLIISSALLAVSIVTTALEGAFTPVIVHFVGVFLTVLILSSTLQITILHLIAVFIVLGIARGGLYYLFFFSKALY